MVANMVAKCRGNEQHRYMSGPVAIFHALATATLQRGRGGLGEFSDVNPLPLFDLKLLHGLQN